MEQLRLTGPQAGSLKYDLLTALSVTGLAGKPVEQTSMIRLVALVTARYNWFRDEVTVGQRDLARMWSVDERTVKRQMKRLVDAGILHKLRPGVRGRVAAYRLNYAEIIKASQPFWNLVGPDFVERMGALYPHAAVKVVKVDFVAKEISLPEDGVGGRSDWREICRHLRDKDAAGFASWYSKLQYVKIKETTLILRAPNAFFARYIETHLSKPLLEATQLTNNKIQALRIEVQAG